MPVIAVAVAIGASAMAASTVAAVGLTLVSALEVVAAVGATLGAIGTITRDKGLTMAGTVIGAIGAVGGLAAGAGLLGSAASSDAPLFGAAPTASTADAASAGTVDFVTSAPESAAASGGVEAGTWDVPASVGSVDASGSITTQLASSAPVPIGSEMAAPDAAALKANTDTFIGAATSDPVGQTAIAAPMGAPDSTATPLMGPQPSGSGGGLSDIWGSSGLTAQQAAMAKALPPGVSGPVLGSAAVAGEGGSGIAGAASGLLDFAQKNPVVALGALQSAGSLLSGLTSTVTPAQVTALNAQAAANDATAALTKQQTANLAMPKSVASSAPVTGAPASLVPQMGMINQPKQVQVTGAPA